MNHTIKPAYALLDKDTNFICIGPDGCLAIFDTRKEAMTVKRTYKDTKVVPVTIGRFVKLRIGAQ